MNHLFDLIKFYKKKDKVETNNKTESANGPLNGVQANAPKNGSQKDDFQINDDPTTKPLKDDAQLNRTTFQLEGDTIKIKRSTVQPPGEDFQDNYTAVQPPEEDAQLKRSSVQPQGDGVQGNPPTIKPEEGSVPMNSSPVQPQEDGVQLNSSTIKPEEGGSVPMNHSTVQSKGKQANPSTIKPEEGNVALTRSSVQPQEDGVPVNRSADQPQGDDVQGKQSTIKPEEGSVPLNPSTVQPQGDAVQMNLNPDELIRTHPIFIPNKENVPLKVATFQMHGDDVQVKQSTIKLDEGNVPLNPSTVQPQGDAVQMNHFIVNPDELLINHPITKPNEENVPLNVATFQMQGDGAQVKHFAVKPYEGDVPLKLSKVKQHGDGVPKNLPTFSPQGDGLQVKEATINPDEGSVPIKLATFQQQGDGVQVKQSTIKPDEGNVPLNLQPQGDAVQVNREVNHSKPDEGSVPLNPSTVPPQGDYVHLSYPTIKPSEEGVEVNGSKLLPEGDGEEVNRTTFQLEEDGVRVSCSKVRPHKVGIQLKRSIFKLNSNGGPLNPCKTEDPNNKESKRNMSTWESPKFDKNVPTLLQSDLGESYLNYKKKKDDFDLHNITAPISSPAYLIKKYQPLINSKAFLTSSNYLLTPSTLRNGFNKSFKLINMIKLHLLYNLSKESHLKTKLPTQISNAYITEDFINKAFEESFKNRLRSRLNCDKNQSKRGATGKVDENQHTEHPTSTSSQSETPVSIKNQYFQTFSKVLGGITKQFFSLFHKTSPPKNTNFNEKPVKSEKRSFFKIPKEHLKMKDYQKWQKLSNLTNHKSEVIRRYYSSISSNRDISPNFLILPEPIYTRPKGYILSAYEKLQEEKRSGKILHCTELTPISEFESRKDSLSTKSSSRSRNKEYYTRCRRPCEKNFENDECLCLCEGKKSLQPQYPILPELERVSSNQTLFPEPVNSNLKFEYMRHKLGIPKTGITLDCSSFQDALSTGQLRIKRYSKQKTPNIQDCPSERSEIYCTKNDDICSTEEKECFLMKTDNKDVKNSESAVSECTKEGVDKSSSIWEKVSNYFKARPNCPAPDEWKKKSARKKAERYAKQAGLCICEAKDLTSDNCQLSPKPIKTGKKIENLPRVITCPSKRSLSFLYTGYSHQRSFSMYTMILRNDRDRYDITYLCLNNDANLSLYKCCPKIIFDQTDLRTFINFQKNFSTSAKLRKSKNKDSKANKSLDALSINSNDKFNEFPQKAIECETADNDKLYNDMGEGDNEPVISPKDRAKYMHLIPKKCYPEEDINNYLDEINRVLEEKENLELSEKSIKAFLGETLNYHYDDEDDDVGEYGEDRCASNNSLLNSANNLFWAKANANEGYDESDEELKYEQGLSLTNLMEGFPKVDSMSEMSYEEEEKMKTNKLINELNKLIAEDE